MKRIGKSEDIYKLERFIEVQDKSFHTALSEIRSGRKSSHWIWYIFPQLRGLGRSAFANYYGISNKDEAKAYIKNPKLNVRLREITMALLTNDEKSAQKILGEIDAMKVRSSMTLFDNVSPHDIYAEVLDKFYSGIRCEITMNLLRGPSDLISSLNYIGVDLDDFTLSNSMFTRPHHAPIHGIGHIYRTMIGCALLGEMLQKPREGLLAFCGAYIHDLARKTDGKEPKHGANAVVNHFDMFNHIWDKYHLTQEEREDVKQAVIQHSGDEWMQPKDSGYHVMAILKDADALDRCRIGDLVPEWLRYIESKSLIECINRIYIKTKNVNDDISLNLFIKMFVD